MPLTELQVRSAMPQPKVSKLSDGGGLQLWVTPNGAKRWPNARADYWDERVRMMNWWADKCEELRRGGVVVPLRA